jgi:hypothetical protein
MVLCVILVAVTLIVELALLSHEIYELAFWILLGECIALITMCNSFLIKQSISIAQ